MVLPFTPTVSLPAGQAEVSTTLAGPPDVGPLPPGAVVVDVLRLLPHAAAAIAATTSRVTRRSGPNPRRRERRETFIGDVLSWRAVTSSRGRVAAVGTGCARCSRACAHHRPDRRAERTRTG